MSTDRSTTISHSIEGELDAETERELPRLILAFECRNPFVPAVRLILTGIDEILIGRGDRGWERRGRTLDIKVSDYEISRGHVRIARHEDAWELFDLGSKNGTAINGTVVTRAILADGDVIEVGGAMFIYRDDDVPGAYDVGDLDLGSTATLPAAFRTLNVDYAKRAADLVKIAPSPVPILIRGETGTGKELTAQAIHELSNRRGAFVAINCGALPRTLVESELFGSKRGAFSGARDDREGLVRRADGGTLFLDEIAELPEESQVALLRVLQEGEVRPIGSSESIKVNVRIIAATHQDLEARIGEGRFRQDLYGRLLGYVAFLPPLRYRREDLGTLIGTLLARSGASERPVTLQRQAARALLAYAYPLNVRELEQALRTALALSDGRELRAEHLPDAIRNYRAAGTTVRPEDQALRDKLAELLREHRGNVTAVGRAIGKAPIQIRRWCKRFSLSISQFRD